MAYSGPISQIRRSRTYGRRFVSTIMGGIKRNCFFMHIPKCGGTSLSEGLNALVPLYKRIGVVDANATRRAIGIVRADRDDNFVWHDDLERGGAVHELREQMLLTHMAWSTPLVYGHVFFSERAWRHFGESYHFVTLMREPVSRTISSFAHSAFNGLVENDFDAYLQGPFIRTHGLGFLRYFSGRHWIPETEEADALEVAKRNMGRFSVIGFLDDLPRFEQDVTGIVGRALKIYHYNEKRNSPPMTSMEQDLLLKQRLATEIKLWEYARDKFN